MTVIYSVLLEKFTAPGCTLTITLTINPNPYHNLNPNSKPGVVTRELLW